ncbi:MAG: beta-galactosidase, partial [Victivallales bacterium]|nr:beta-galactosidase [Victivallales bacterium]
MRSVEIDRARILVNGKEERIISAGMHYFRIHPELWADRIAKAVAFGANAIETYIPWNLHEPEQGKFNFSGIADFERFIDLVQAHNLYMIVRPSPYICAEWDNGGLPAWLNAVPGIKMRRMNEAYLEAVSDYYDVLLPKIQKKLYTNGGPIIMLSLENEYGSYCHDKEYLRRMLSFYQKHNINVPIFTNDGHLHFYLSGGALPGTMMTMNFGSHSEEAWRNREQWRPDAPDFCMEFWVGWFDHWGEKHHVRAAGADGSAEDELEKMLEAGAHVNFYMFHGGTNFGFTNGANGHYFSDYAATVSSYDYDSPLSECGDPTEKFYRCQQIIKKHTDNPRIAPIEPTVKIVPPAVKLNASAGLFDNLKVLSTHFGKAAEPPLME